MRVPPALLRGLAAGLAATTLACDDGGSTPAVEPEGYLGPTLTLEAPGRAETIEGDGGSVALAGRACDPVHALVAADLGGAPVALAPSAAGTDGCREWTAVVEARAGLNVVRGGVTNDAGERGTLAQSFLRAPAYFDPDGPGAAAESGIVLQLGPDFLDDGDRASLDDVASLLEQVLRARDLDAAVGAVRFASPDANGDGEIDSVTRDCVFWTERNKRTGFEAWKSGPLTHGGVFVDALALEDGGLVARLSIRNVRVPFGVMGNLDSGCLGDAQKTVHGDVTAGAIAVEAHVAVGLDAEGRPTVTSTSTTASLSNLDIDIDLGVLVDWTGLGSLIGDTIEARVRGQILSGIREGAGEALVAELARMLARLAALGGEVALPPELGGGVVLLESGLDRLELTAGHAVLGARVRATAAASQPGHAGARGAMRLGGAAPDPAALEGDPVALAVADDVLNQLLHAAWLAGAFDVDDLAAVVPLGDALPGARIALFSRLPPVVMPRRGDPGGVDIGWGDLAFDLAFSGPRGAANVRGFLSLVVGLDRLEVDASGGLRPVFAPEAEVAVQVTQVDWDHLPTTRKLTEGLVAALVRNALPDLLGKAAVSIPLPSLDLGSLDPDLGSITLALDAPRVIRLGRYQVLAGGVAARP